MHSLVHKSKKKATCETKNLKPQTSNCKCFNHLRACARIHNFIKKLLKLR